MYNIFCGATSGAIANGIANPTDVLKVRMQAKSSGNLSMTRSFIDMATHEGFKGLYRGMLPNMQRAAVITGVELPVYDSAKNMLVEDLHMNPDNLITHIWYFSLFSYFRISHKCSFKCKPCSWWICSTCSYAYRCCQSKLLA